MCGMLDVATARSEGLDGEGESHMAWKVCQAVECGARLRVECGGRRGQR